MINRDCKQDNSKSVSCSFANDLTSKLAQGFYITKNMDNKQEQNLGFRITIAFH